MLRVEDNESETDEFDRLMSLSRKQRHEVTSLLEQGAQGAAVMKLSASFANAVMALQFAGNEFDEERASPSDLPGLHRDLLLGAAERIMHAAIAVAAASRMMLTTILWQDEDMPWALNGLKEQLTTLVTAEIKARREGAIAHAIGTIQASYRRCMQDALGFVEVFEQARESNDLERLELPARRLDQTATNEALSIIVAYNVLDTYGLIK